MPRDWTGVSCGTISQGGVFQTFHPLYSVPRRGVVVARSPVCCVHFTWRTEVARWKRSEKRVTLSPASHGCHCWFSRLCQIEGPAASLRVRVSEVATMSLRVDVDIGWGGGHWHVFGSVFCRRGGEGKHET